MTNRLSIVVVEEDRDRAISIVDALRDGGEYDVHVIGDVSGLARKIAAFLPDVVLIDVDNPTRDMLEELTLASGPLDRPVAMFVSGGASGLAKAAVEAGVSAYVVDGLQPERLSPILEAAMARFQMSRQMRDRACRNAPRPGGAQSDRPRQGAFDESPRHRRGRSLRAPEKNRDGPGPPGGRSGRGAGDGIGAPVMTTVTLPIAYMPLVDAAPVIVAEEMGFAAAEGLSLDLVAAPSWSSLRDMLAFGRVDAAHMLSPVPVAMAMGLGGVRTPVSAVSILSVNGNVIGVSREIEAKLLSAGYTFDFSDAARAGAALAQVIPDGITVGIPFPFSMHAELLHYWVAATPLAQKSIEIRTVPPPLMAKALATGDIDAFCVGEPWGSVAVDDGSGALILPGSAIWRFAPEKVLATRTDWAETEPQLLGHLMRAVWRAGRWLAQPESRTAAAEILSRPGHLALPAELIDRALSGALTISSQGQQARVPNFLEFHAGAASFPWRSQAKWMAHQLAQRAGLDRFQAQDAAGAVFRSDLYRTAMASTRADLPGASEKLEGALAHETAVASTSGKMILHPDGFFDGRVFDPSRG